jgi:hypothetical protein
MNVDTTTARTSRKLARSMFEQSLDRQSPTDQNEPHHGPCVIRSSAADAKPLGHTSCAHRLHPVRRIALRHLIDSSRSNEKSVFRRD